MRSRWRMPPLRSAENLKVRIERCGCSVAAGSFGTVTEPAAVTPPGAIPPATNEPASSASQAGFRAMWERWTSHVFTMREDRFFLFLAVLIGILSGLAVVCFRIAIEWTDIELLGSSLSPTFPRVVLAPTLAGIVVALLVIYAFPRECRKIGRAHV